MDGLDIFRRNIETTRAPARPPGRLKLWELPETFLCSVIGTCLSVAELRSAMTRLNLAPASASDHDLHSRAVGLAAHQGQGSKLLGKALDERWRLDIARFDRAADEDAVRALWQQARRRGDIPGAYWATLTHPATTAVLRNAAFGDVHMLSHLLGAANRADIQRLTALEEQNIELRSRLDRERTVAQGAVACRDARIAALERDREAPRGCGAPGSQALSQPAERRLEGLEDRLTTEIARRTAAEQKLADRKQAVSDERSRREAAEQLVTALQAEIAALERCLAPPVCETDGQEQRLDGLRLLYVGGRLSHIGHIRAIGERLGATVDHHDGGLETSTDRLAGLASRADHVLFPVDCVSHEATVTIKRLCRQLGKRYTPLRAGGVGTFVAALASEVAPAGKCC